MELELTPTSVITFQSRRLKTWGAVKPWFFVFALGAIIELAVLFIDRKYVQTNADPFYSSVKFGMTQDTSVEAFTFGLIALVLMGTAIIAASSCVRRFYRCPVCDTVPMGSWHLAGPSVFGTKDGVDLNPSVCPKCGARLR